MKLVKLATAVFKLFALLLVFAISSKGGRGKYAKLHCQTLAFELFAFSKPSDSLDCKQACDERFAALRKMPHEGLKGVNLLSSSSYSTKTRADAHGIFWIDQCVVWLRYCFRQRAPMPTVDKNALDSQRSVSTVPALICLCRTVFLLMQVRSPAEKYEVGCEPEKICERLTSRLNLKQYGTWSCKESIFATDVSCSMAVPICLCCWSKQNHHRPKACADFPELDKLMNEPFVLGDQEWQAYQLNDEQQPEEGFPPGTDLEPQGLACSVEQEDSPRFKAASLPFRTFDTSAYVQAGSCAVESSVASQTHSHLEAISEAGERAHQLQDCVRPPQKQGKKRKAANTAEASCSVSALASIRQQPNGRLSHGSQFSEAHSSPFTTMDDGELFFGPEFVFPQATGDESNSLGGETGKTDPDNLHFGHLLAESSDIAAEHATAAIDPDNLRFSDYFSRAGAAATTEPIPSTGPSNPDDSFKETQDDLNAFEGIL